MKKTPKYLVVISLFGTISALLGIIIAFMIPGTIAYAPLTIGIILGLISIGITKKNKYKCYGGYISSVLAIIGIIITLSMQAKEPEVAVDKQFKEKTEESAEEVETGDELDNALDDLDIE